MKACGYYSFFDSSVDAYNRCSINSDESPLIVNCAGCFCSAFPFTTDNPSGRHDFYFMYIKTGSLNVRFLHGDQTAQAGDALIFSPHYHYRYSFSGGGELSYLWCHFTGSDAKNILSDLGLVPDSGIYRIGHEGLVTAEFEKIFSAFSEDARLRPRVLGHALGGLLISISGAMCGESREKKPLEHAIDYINGHYTKKISIPKLAQLENLSNSRFSVVFCERFGMSPVRYITKLRMQHACGLLLSTNLSVKQVGSTVGYDDPHFFSKHFKAFIGISPSEYRENGGNDQKI